jgi:hypothetical protein
MLQAGLSKRVHLFLSDVETSTWSQQDLEGVVSSAAQVIITEGEKGATLLAAAQESSVDSSSKSRSSDSKSSSSSSASEQQKIPAVKVRTGLAAPADQCWLLSADVVYGAFAWRCSKAHCSCWLLLPLSNHARRCSPAAP